MDGAAYHTVQYRLTETAIRPLTSPPPLVSRQSHAGYLTASSPLIKTSTITDSPTSDSYQADSNEASEQPHRASTLPVSGSVEPTNLEPVHAATSYSRDGTDRSPSRSRRGVGSLLSLGDKNSSLKARTNSRGSKSTEPLPQVTQVYGNGSTRSNQAALPKIDPGQRTPPSAALERPRTTVTPPTPTLEQRRDKSSPTKGSPRSDAGSSTTNTGSHRRARSDSVTHVPSRLSNSITAPLTPTIEETKAQGARTPNVQGSPGSSGGFFSSVFTAAQSAANTFTNTISNNSQQRPKSADPSLDEPTSKDLQEEITTNTEDGTQESKPDLAIHTLGSGDLSLSHLGIADPPGIANSIASFPSITNGNLIEKDEQAAKVEDMSAARAVSAAYSEPGINGLSSTPIAEDKVQKARTPIMDANMRPESTTPNGSILDGEMGLRRSGSVRSRVERVTRRHRNSSSATAGTAATTGTSGAIAAAIGAGHSALANPAASVSSPKLTGFAVASKKRNRDFHQLFKSIPDDDYLIEDYSAALQRDIILAGRLYVSENHICFSSNILGWVTTLIVSFDEIVSVEKESTAVVFPNAIAIQTLHARQTFRSLLSRESTYELIIGIWKINHPNIKSIANGARLDQDANGAKAGQAGLQATESDSEDSEDEEEVYDEDEDVDEESGTVIGNGVSPVTSDVGDPSSKAAIRKASALGITAGAAAGSVPTPGEVKAAEKAAAASAAANDFPGPATHAPTECGDQDTHYEKSLQDVIIPAPLGKVYSMVFGPASGGFMSRWLLDEIKVTDLQMEDDKKGISGEVTSRSYSYVKPLGASIGPKSTKCLVTEHMDFFDLEKAISVTSSTQTPDVPSGNIFVVKTKFCMTWAPGNATRFLMSCSIEWSGKSWLKGPIEKGANDGQLSYGNDLVRSIKAGLSSRPRAGTLNSKMKGKGKRRKVGADVSKDDLTHSTSQAEAANQSSNWGLFGPLHGILGPVTGIVGPLISANVIIGILLLYIVFSWWCRPSPSPKGAVGFPRMTPSERMVAYEELWRQEESELWSWLEDRIGMEDLVYPAAREGKDRDAVAKAKREREKALQARSMERRLKEDEVSDRQVDDAIRIAEERLEALKSAKENRKGTTGKQPEKDGGVVQHEP